jgi:hypothetical protein
MILGMSIGTFTLLHVIISLVGVGSGLVVAFAMLKSKQVSALTALFLITTILTSVTGYFFHPIIFDPAEIVGFISLAVLALALLALYGLHLKGLWRPVYVVTALIALYLNCFVTVVQSFGKIEALRALAPTQKEPPFMVAQAVLLLAFIMLGVFAVRRFRPAAA